jgi:acetylglutamate kinase
LDSDQIFKRGKMMHSTGDRYMVCKVSGKVVEDQDSLRVLAKQIITAQVSGLQFILVHGGGKQLDELAMQMSIPQKKILGRRITDAETLRLAMMTFNGQVNTELTALLLGSGMRAVGLSGVDGRVVSAKRRSPLIHIDAISKEASEIDLGFVGDVVSVDVRLLKVLCDSGYVPVIASLGVDEDGQVLNINADTVASEIALALDAEAIIYLSDVNGVFLDLEDPSTLQTHITAAEISRLIQCGAISNGMLPKLESIRTLLERGLRSARILSGANAMAFHQVVCGEESVGTLFTLE